MGYYGTGKYSSGVYGGAAAPAPASATRLPGTITQTAVVGNDDWLDLVNMGLDDGMPSTCDLTGNGVSETVSLTNFGFTIPGAATIVGVTVEIDRQKQDRGGQCKDSAVRLKKSGATGANKASATGWPDSYAVASYGGPTDLWGLTLTAAEVNNSAFGLDFKVLDADQSDVAEVDFIRITVDYTV